MTLDDFKVILGEITTGRFMFNYNYCVDCLKLKRKAIGWNLEGTKRLCRFHLTKSREVRS